MFIYVDGWKLIRNVLVKINRYLEMLDITSLYSTGSNLYIAVNQIAGPLLFS